MRAELGEGVVWVERDKSVYYVDLLGHAIHRVGPDGRYTTWAAPAEPGFLYPLDADSFVCGMRGGLYRFRFVDGAFDLMVSVEPELPEHRLNDGFMDASGRLWFGTMHQNCRTPGGALYSWRPGDSLRVHDSGYIITNGPVMSLDGRTLYHTDSALRVVYAFDVTGDGSLANRRTFLTFGQGVYPDGMAVDRSGNLWVALYGGWRVECYSPLGVKVSEVRFPCANVTKPAFGGRNGSLLYVTSGWSGLTEAERERQPDAGALFCVSCQPGS